MANKIPIERFINAVLSLRQLKKMSNLATAKAGINVRVLATPTSRCCSYKDYYAGPVIELGRQFYTSTFSDTDDVSVVDTNSKYKRIASIMYGVYYHELFHVLYTPFKYAEKLTEKCPYYFRQFSHQVSNILEDVTIEESGCYKYPPATPFIDAVRECFILPQQLEALKEALTNEPDSPGTMLAYLLHYCRGTDLTKYPPYKIWEDNKEFIEWGVYKCINTIDPHLRIRRQLSFALQLCKILDMQEPSKEDVEDSSKDLESESSSLSSKSISGAGARALSPLQSMTDITSGGFNNQPQNAEDTKKNTEGDTEEDTEEDNKELSTQKAGRNTDSSFDTESPLTSDLTKESISILANDEPVYRYSHYADKLSKYMDTSIYLSNYNSIVEKVETQIRRVVAIIRKMHATNNTSWNHYKMRGKLDSSTFYKKGNYKIFKTKNAPAPAADLVIELLLDCSGSMYGDKAKLAGKALIIFCEALNRLHIPFSVDAFTEDTASVTISLKDYNESYDKQKTNMTLFTELFFCRPLHTWGGNIDEINLQFVSRSLLERKEKDKILIVISDGATCGSKNDLKRVAENIENQGVTVLGIGIFDSNVKDIYKNHVILKTQDDLEMLGAFLNKYLLGKIFK